VDPERQLAGRLTRTRLLGAVLEAVAMGGVLAGLALRWGFGASAFGAGVLAIGIAAVRWTRLRAARAMERDVPALGQSVQAWVEGGGGPLRSRLAGWVAARSRVPRFGGRWAAALVGVGLLVAGLAGWPPGMRRGAEPPAASPGAPVALAVAVHVVPPAYAGQPEVDAAPPRVEALKGSTVSVRIASAPGAVRVSEPGAADRMLQPGASMSLQLGGNVALRFEAAAAAPVVLQLVALADRPPDVVLEAPDADRTVTRAPGAFAVRAVARDDVGVEGLVLRWTLAQGRGEEMRFRNGTLAARLTLSAGGTEATATLDPRALGMRAGDSLVVWAEASDGNAVDGPGVGRSASRLLRWDVPLPELVQGGKGPPLPLKGPLTERELLRRAEALVRSGAPAAVRRRRARELGEEQRTLRESFAFFVQTETGDALQLDVDDPERAEGGPLAIRRRLAEAVSAMWEAEGALATGDARGALRPMRAAVAALEAAFAAEKKVLAAGRPPDKPVDESRRFRGKQEGLRPRLSSEARRPRPWEDEVRALALELLLAAQGPEAPPARRLGDALWKLSPGTGLPAPELAAALYAARDADEARAAVARAAGVLVGWLSPGAPAIPPRDPAEPGLLSGVAPR
jgi:hypothetical protein